MIIKSKEEIFDLQAKIGMIEYYPAGFRKKYSTLFTVIMNAMEAYKNQELNKNIKAILSKDL